MIYDVRFKIYELGFSFVILRLPRKYRVQYLLAMTGGGWRNS
ncbi:MAG: hypothetical protein UR66_C0009G0089 [Candidatus Moranbacteria bacterium GW2011_GWE1_35_17]|nr:MAG: hypothetical protein UR65_C0069G0002 [Candidatus Moranbacteria bacterium GW2011_GWE2_35_164]KKP67999.1 MAG: hypothetical protein UR66_C0009G0089 [Candidatus Moranbacteria bacterium GW2011_GWE1_35_17]KKP83969.1 MAG: hypothetical protein UR83_C0029G0002 [Candidatus Moranbacteria bacterium GW2011_GWF2_35_54]KKP84173.1 MAG: hypothetical protein UR82_C0011G0021 [Candidatus Moranbacteria bacterium GW2011_GWF1_35_5]